MGQGTVAGVSLRLFKVFHPGSSCSILLASLLRLPTPRPPTRPMKWQQWLIVALIALGVLVLNGLAKRFTSWDVERVTGRTLATTAPPPVQP